MEHKAATGREHILVCLSSSPSNAKIIKTAAEMATAFGGKFTALYVNTPRADSMSGENHDRLETHIRLAEELGAEIATLYGEDVAEQILEFSRLSGITKIVLGRSNVIGGFFKKQTLTDKIIKSSLGLDIHIIPDTEIKAHGHFDEIFSAIKAPTLKEWGWTLLLLFLSTVLGFVFHSLNFTDANTITVYMLGVLIAALVTKNYICSGVFSLASVLMFNFFFTEPRLTFKAYESGYPVTFVIMLVVSLIMGTLANRLATSAKLSAAAAYRTNIMLETNQLLQKADSEEAVVETMTSQLQKLLSRHVVVYPVKEDDLGAPRLFPSEHGKDLPAALLTVAARERALASITGSLRPEATGPEESHGIYLPVKTGDAVFFVVGIAVGSKPIEPFENSILTSILGESALAIENLRNVKEKEEIALLAENEKLRANLLRAISHDLRTPLTSISGNAENLLANFEQIDEGTRTRLLTDISEDAEWLISLVENLLSISRISEGRMNLHRSPQLVDEVVTEALRHILRKATEHSIKTDFGEELLLADMDARLISQVIINLVDNAVKYTKKGSHITVSAKSEGDRVRISVADDGDGIPDLQKADVFRMFYTGNNNVADCRRSLGLGLSLCESIVRAHGSELSLRDNQPHGCIFTFTLEKSEVELLES